VSRVAIVRGCCDLLHRVSPLEIRFVDGKSFVFVGRGFSRDNKMIDEWGL
jgi:hypothetical protein